MCGEAATWVVCVEWTPRLPFTQSVWSFIRNSFFSLLVLYTFFSPSQTLIWVQFKSCHQIPANVAADFKAKLFVGVSRPTFSHSEKSFHFISDLMSFWQDEAEPSMISEWRRITSVCEPNVSVNSSMDLKFASFPCSSEKCRLAPPRYISALIGFKKYATCATLKNKGECVMQERKRWYSCWNHA